MRAIRMRLIRPFCRRFALFFERCSGAKKLESMTLDGHYLLSGDGTGFYSSTKVASPYCLKKTRCNGVAMYYQQMYAAALVHPDRREVITFFPEMITRQTVREKRLRAERSPPFLRRTRREHPHLKLTSPKMR